MRLVNKMQWLLCSAAILTACGGDNADAPETLNLSGLRCSGSESSGWCWQQPQPDALATRDVVFSDANSGWLVGDFGLLMSSNDGGANWSKHALATQSDLTLVRFATPRNGWLAAATGGEVWRTIDAGRTWVRVNHMPVRVATQMWALSDRVVVITGFDGTDSTPDVSMVSDDGGQTWRRAALVVQQVEADGTLWSFGGHSRSSDLGLTSDSTPPAGWTEGASLRDVGFGPVGTAWAQLDQYDSISRTWRNLLARRTSATGPWSTAALVAPAASPNYQLVSMTLDTKGDGLALAWPDPLPSGDIQPFQRFARTSDGGAQWQWFNVPGTEPNPWVSSYNFADNRTMIVQLEQAAGRSRHLTTDAGQTWRSSLPTSGSSLIITRDGGGQLLASAGQGERWRSTDEGQTWRNLPSRPFDGAAVAALWMGADGRGTAVAGSTLLETQDSGRTWTAQANALPDHDDVQLRADGSGWLLSGGRLSRTADGGRTWQPQATASGATSTPVRVLYAEGLVLRLEALATCNSDSTIKFCYTVLHASDDGGATWRVGTGTLRWVDGFMGRAVAFATPQIAVRVDLYNAERSTDGGLTWGAVNAPGLQGNITRVRFQDANRGWMLGMDGAVLRTLDGGATWASVAVPVPMARSGASARPALNAITFADANNGWIVGDEGVVLATRNGGANWVLQPSATPYALKSVFARDSRSAWAGGALGSILATATAGQAVP